MRCGFHGTPVGRWPESPGTRRKKIFVTAVQALSVPRYDVEILARMSPLSVAFVPGPMASDAPHAESGDAEGLGAAIDGHDLPGAGGPGSATDGAAANEPGYWAVSRAPLTSLVFALPLVLAYEGGVLLLGRGTPRNGADVWLRQTLDALGFGSYFLLPTLTVVGLLAWHHIEHDRWHVRPGVLVGMALECGIWAAVLLGSARLQGRLWPDFLPLAVGPGREGVLARVIGFCGAGLYEEVLFRLLILPAWMEAPPEHAGRRVIRLDPGSAFGTGSHPTTRLCLEALEGLAASRPGELAGLRVADLGCGSGVLALAALAFGADAVAAADTDSLAVTATWNNARLNGPAPQERLQVVQGSAEALAALQGPPADLLLCNILAPVIEALAPQVAALLAPTGQGLLSGLLVEQAPRLEQVLAEEGWRARLEARQGPWGLMSLRWAAAVA